MSAEGLLTRWRAAAAIARNTLAPPDRADPVLVDIAAMLPTEDQPDVAAVLVWIAEHRCQFALPGADVAALCQGLQLPPDAPADELTGDEQRLRNAVAVLLAHPSFQHR